MVWITFGVALAPFIIFCAWGISQLVKCFGFRAVLLGFFVSPAYFIAVTAMLREMSKFMKDFSYDILSGLAVYEWVCVAILVIFLVIVPVIMRRFAEADESE